MVIIIIFNNNVTIPACPKYEKIFSHSSIHIEANTIINNIPVIFSIIEIFEIIKFSANFLITIPNITGIVTTPAILIAIPVIVISSEILEILNNFAEDKIINGTEKINTLVENAFTDGRLSQDILLSLIEDIQSITDSTEPKIITKKKIKKQLTSFSPYNKK